MPDFTKREGELIHRIVDLVLKDSPELSERQVVKVLTYTCDVFTRPLTMPPEGGEQAL